MTKSNLFPFEIDLLNNISLPTYETFSTFLDLHLNIAENLSNKDVWGNSRELKEYLEQLKNYSDIYQKISFKEYLFLLKFYLKSAFYRGDCIESRVTLLKPVDARLHKADLIILAGLNETTWPNKPYIDPCFNNHLLRTIGLPISENYMGEETYDFMCLAQAKQVIITRSEKLKGIAANPSRWLLRLLSLAKKNPQTNSVELLSPKNKLTLLPPTPSINYRPSRLSATQIDKLVFNPYHIYVDLILKLKQLPSLSIQATAIDFGIFVHKALELYHQNTDIFEAGKKSLDLLKVKNNQIISLWWPRYIRIAKWFLENENKACKAYLENSGYLKINNDFLISAKADRIEISSNIVNIIDYKTGRLATNKAIFSGQNLQLLIEAIIAKNSGFSCQDKIQSYTINKLEYIQLSGGEEPAQILGIDLKDGELINKAEIYIKELIKEYESSPYFYTQKKNLGYCYYEHLARMFN